jgi:hypothetical protein
LAKCLANRKMVKNLNKYNILIYMNIYCYTVREQR